MCGIAAIFNYKSDSPIDPDELVQIRDHMAKRGPDGIGEWYSSDRRVGMGHRRLSIIDLSEAGKQPMCNEDETIWMAFNGEIYNYGELRGGLRAEGHRFKSASDTEVIIHGYEEWGAEGVLKRLRGMFAFALWDEEKKGMFLARDPFGIKPLYYADDGKTLRIASQVKALLAGRKIDTTPEPAGHVGFFLWGHVPEPYSIYRGVRSLPAGSYMWVDQADSASSKNYCSIPEILSQAEEAEIGVNNKEEMRERLRASLLDSVKHHLIADVPVGVFLSAGLDSSTLVGLSSEIEKNKLHTVTLGFREYAGTPDDETPFAALVAEQCDAEHRTIWVSRDDFHAGLDRVMDAMDQPTIDGVNSYFVSGAASQSGLKVALSGLGGDELFGGYPGFSEIPSMVKTFRPFSAIPFLGKGFRIITEPLIKRLTSPKYAGLFEYGGSYEGAYLLRRGMFMPWELPRLLDGEMVREGWGELQTLLRLEETHSGINRSHMKVSALEMCWYMRNQLLRDTDWASMAHSLEVRVPLVDTELLRRVAPLFNGNLMPDKRDMAFAPKRPLPSEILNRGKTGFSVPVRDWRVGEEKGNSGERGLRGWAEFVYGKMVP